jgi:protein TonB
MFDTTLMDPRSAHDVGRKLLALPAALGLHMLVLGAVMVGQLWAVGNVPEPETAITFFTLPPPPPPFGRAHGRTGERAAATRHVAHTREVQPRVVPVSTPKTGEAPSGSSEADTVPNGDPEGDPNGNEFSEALVPMHDEPPADKEHIYRLDLVMTQPVPVVRTAPTYPEVARHLRREGVVIVEAVISREGTVVDVRLLKDPGFGMGDAALAAIRNWRYQPATLDGRRVSVYLTVVVKFELHGDS